MRQITARSVCDSWASCFVPWTRLLPTRG